MIGGNFFHIVLDHDFYKLFKSRLLRVPAEFFLSLGWVTPEVHHVGRAVEIFGHGNNGLAGGNVNALFVHAFAFPAEFYTCVAESESCKFTDGVLYAGCNHEVFGFIVLKNEPHAFHVVLGVAPVAEAVEVTKIQAVLLVLGDTGGGKRNLAGHKGFSTTFRFMVKEDARTAEHVVRFAVFLDNPKSVKFSHGIWAIRMERGIFVLRDFFYLAIEFAGRCLVDAASLFQVVGTDSFQNAEHARSIYVGGKFRGIKRNLHMALRGKVVNFGRLHLAHHLHKAHGVTHVGIVQVEIRLAFQVRNAFTIVYRRTADNAVDFVALGKEEFRKVRAILARDAGDQCNVFSGHIFLF